MAELADAHDSGSCVQYALAGSSPVSRTTETLATQGFPLLFGLRYPHGTPTGFLEVWVRFGYGSQRIEKFLHPVRTLPPHGFCHMSVTVQRKCRGIVSGILLDRFYVVPGPEGIHHIGVPEIVETVPFQSGLPENLLEGLPDRRLRQVAPVRVCEDQVGKAAVIPLLKSTQSQVKPSSSPERIPVKRAVVMIASYSSPWIASSSFLRSGVSKGCISACRTVGRIQALVGFFVRYPIRTAISRALCRQPWMFLIDLGLSPFASSWLYIR